jgi:hypothetical protein
MKQVYILTTVLILIFYGFSIAQNTPISLADTGLLHLYTGRTVTVTGIISNIMQTHIIAPPDGYPIVEYLDSDKTQTVMYLKKKSGCSGKVRITGKVLSIHGAPTPENSKLKSKAEGFVEYHIAVDACECIN